MYAFDLAIAETNLAADFQDTQLDAKKSYPVFLIIVHKTSVASAFRRLVETIQRTDLDYRINSASRYVHLNGIRIKVVAPSASQIRGETLIGAVLDSRALHDMSEDKRSDMIVSLHFGMRAMRKQGFQAALVISPVM